MDKKPKWYQSLEQLPPYEPGFKEPHRQQVLRSMQQERNARKSQKKRWRYPPAAATAAVLILCAIALLLPGQKDIAFPPSPSNPSYTDGVGSRYIAATLNEEMWHVDAIIAGRVIEALDSTTMENGIRTKVSSAADITPALVEVQEVLYGEVDTANAENVETKEAMTTITLLQHGKPSTPGTSLVNAGEQLILILVRTTAGEYWAYDHHNGIWHIRDGIVEAPNAIFPMDGFNGMDAETFKRKLAAAAKHKKKPVGIL